MDRLLDKSGKSQGILSVLKVGTLFMKLDPEGMSKIPHVFIVGRIQMACFPIIYLN